MVLGMFIEKKSPIHHPKQLTANIFAIFLTHGHTDGNSCLRLQEQKVQAKNDNCAIAALLCEKRNN